ncbi:MAG: hypothetical protein MI810_20095 [Flavobacteriales bacterium]|nr:hypothetical protein [Flavobacteriales bacterium]
MKWPFSILLLFLFVPISWGQTNADSSKYVGMSGSFKLSYPSGLVQQVGVDTENKKEGIQYWYSPNNVLIKKVEYTISFPRAGSFEGVHMEEMISEYSETGTLISVTKYVDGEKIPEDENYFPNGQLKYQVINGRDDNHELRVYYHRNGKVRYQTEVLKGQRKYIQDGKEERWNEQGVKLSESSYKNNLKDGLQKQWSESGQLLSETYYVNDTSYWGKWWKEDGEMVQFWSKSAPKEPQFYKEYDKYTGKLKNWTTYKKYAIETDTLLLRYTRQYDKEGIYSETVIKAEGIYGAGRITAQGVTGVLNESYVRNNTFSLSENNKPHQGYEGYRFQPFNRPLEMGFWMKILSIEKGKNIKSYDKDIDEGLKDMEKKVRGEKCSAEYQVDLANIPEARAYFQIFPRQVFFDSAATISDLDSSQTGTYRIVYYGTDMYYEGHLLNDLEHGTSTLYLNDSIKLFEQKYQYGIRHGWSRDWYVDGTLASETLFKMGKDIEVRRFFRSGEVSYYERKKPLGQGMVIEEKHPDKSFKRLLWDKDSTAYQIRFDKEGNLESYTWNNLKEGKILSRTVYKGRNFSTIKIPHIGGDTVRFAMERYGMKVEGKAWWDDEQKKTFLEDSYGNSSLFDRSVISYSKELPCQCKDWEEYDFWAEATSRWSSKSKFLKYQHDFHTPSEAIDFMFGNPYYLGKEPDKYVLGKVYRSSPYFFLLKPLELSLPDTNGITFILEPCKSKFAFIKVSASVEFKAGFPDQTKVSIYRPKSLGIRFPASILTQVDEDYEVLKNEDGSPISALFLFDAQKVDYNKEIELDVINPRLDCSRSVKIGSTSVIFKPYNLLPDFNQVKNYDLMNEQLSANGTYKLFKGEINNDFRGAFAAEGGVALPFQKDYLLCNAKDFVISAKDCLGTIETTTTVNDKEEVILYQKNGGEVVLSKTNFEQMIRDLGFDQFKIIFQVGRPVTVYFYESI